MRKISEKLESKYPDYQKYVAYHKLVGGGAPEYCDKDDFPGTDSVYGNLTLKIIELKATKSKDERDEKVKPVNMNIPRGYRPEETRAEKAARKNKEYRSGQWD